MVDALLSVGELLGKTAVETLDYLTQEDARLTEGVEEGSRRIGEQLLREHV